MTTDWLKPKTGWVIRKHMGYGHIASSHAEAFDQFYREYFDPYLNFHRPCAVPEISVTAKGKQKRVYRWYATPWEILRQVPGVASFVRPELAIDELQRMAEAKDDTQAASKCKPPTQAVRGSTPQAQRVMETGGRWKRRVVESEENQTQLPTFPLVVLVSTNEFRKRRPGGDRFAPAFRLILQ